MKQVGVREFRDHATTYISGSESIAVTKHGNVVGIYYPIKRDQEKVNRALDRFDESIDRILEETGMKRDELADIFDTSKPFDEC